MEPPEPRHPPEPFRHTYTEYGNIDRCRRQDVAQRVGGSDEPTFQQIGDPGLISSQKTFHEVRRDSANLFRACG